MKHKELAEQAGFEISSSNFADLGWVWCSDEYPIDEQLERFAELVRQDERRVYVRSFMELQHAAIEETRLEEREACAKLCEKMSKSTWTFCNFAEAIRARGNK